MATIILGVTGASGISLAHRGLELLTAVGHDVELVVSKAARHTASLELDDPTTQGFFAGLSDEQRGRVTLHKNTDIGASIASGSYPVDAMIIMPCSMATLGAIGNGLGDNLIRRAADVTLKERRRLVIVPREAPLHEIHLEHMLKLTRMGSVVFPPVPGWYARPATIEESDAFIAGRALDQLGVGRFPYQRWGEEPKQVELTTSYPA